MVIRWIDIVKILNKGNPKPEKKVEKTNEEWKSLLDAESYRVTRQSGTEYPFSSDMCSAVEPGKYACVCCGTLLFNSEEKFESGTGWPSFTQPVKENVIAYIQDNTLGSRRVEVACNVCDAHLGHVFPDGPDPSGLRYCINAVSLTKLSATKEVYAKATFGGGCFWCTEAVFQRLKGVKQVVSGYSGGHMLNPTYREVCSGRSGHAEAIEVLFNPKEISFEDLLLIHMSTHDATQVNGQGNDHGTQYRSVIFYRNEEEKEIAEAVKQDISKALDKPVATEILALEHFYSAEQEHQNYYNQNKAVNPYCSYVIEPKLAKLRKLYKEKLEDSEG